MQRLSDMSTGAKVSPNVPSCLCCQYAVPVTKYDRKGYKARSRQLLLTSNSAIIVEDAKVKQRIDYAALKGPRSLCFCVSIKDSFFSEANASSCRYLSQLAQRRPVCPARAR